MFRELLLVFALIWYKISNQFYGCYSATYCYFMVQKMDKNLRILHIPQASCSSAF